MYFSEMNDLNDFKIKWSKSMKQKLLVLLTLILGFSLAAEDKSIAAKAKEAGKFKVLLAAVTEADLAKVLDTQGPFTVLAPTDEAFGKLPAGTVESLLKKENRAKLLSILKFHVIAGKHSALELAVKKQVKTLNGKMVSVSLQNGSLKVQGIGFLATDIKAKNGLAKGRFGLLISTCAQQAGSS